MVRIKRAIGLLAVSLILMACLDGRLYAYIDPGTGSYVFQLLIAGLLGVAFTAKVFWRRITAFLTSRVRRSHSSDGDVGEKNS